MRNRNVFQCNIEFLGTLEEVGSDAIADCFTLCDQFCCIELGDDGLQDFVSNGREDSLVVVLTEILVSLAAIPNALKPRENILGKSWATAEPLVYARL
jgi:hypothetical protein